MGALNQENLFLSIDQPLSKGTHTESTSSMGCNTFYSLHKPWPSLNILTTYRWHKRYLIHTSAAKWWLNLYLRERRSSYQHRAEHANLTYFCSFYVARRGCWSKTQQQYNQTKHKHFNIQSHGSFMKWAQNQRIEIRNTWLWYQLWKVGSVVLTYNNTHKSLSSVIFTYRTVRAGCYSW